MALPGILVNIPGLVIPQMVMMKLLPVLTAPFMLLITSVIIQVLETKFENTLIISLLTLLQINSKL